jgi:hypothetical protein
MTAIEEAAAELATATAARAELSARIAASEAALREATAHREGLAQAAWRGAEIAPRTVSDAGKNIKAAEDQLAFLNLQIPQADAAVESATAAHDGAVQAARDADFAVAVRDLITVSRTLTDLGAAMAAKGDEYLAAYGKVILAKAATGVLPNEADQAGYQSARSRVKCVVPLHIQHAIIASGANNFDVGARDYAHWGRFAAPDAAADRPAVVAAAAQAETVKAQQEFEAAGREQQARSVGYIPSWQPTEMVPSEYWPMRSSVREV